MKTKHKQFLFVIFLLVITLLVMIQVPYISSIVFSILGGLYLGEILVSLTEKVFPNE